MNSSTQWGLYTIEIRLKTSSSSNRGDGTTIAKSNRIIAPNPSTFEFYARASGLFFKKSPKYTIFVL